MTMFPEADIEMILFQEIGFSDLEIRFAGLSTPFSSVAITSRLLVNAFFQSFVEFLASPNGVIQGSIQRIDFINI